MARIGKSFTAGGYEGKAGNSFAFAKWKRRRRAVRRCCGCARSNLSIGVGALRLRTIVAVGPWVLQYVRAAHHQSAMGHEMPSSPKYPVEKGARGASDC